MSTPAAPFAPGTALQKLIHAGLDRLPLSAATRARIKACPGCNRRAKELDRRWLSRYKTPKPN